jgi:Zn-dependent M16 (insulinase) family peptidase
VSCIFYILLWQDGKPVFQDMIRRYLVDNCHRVIVEMVPDTDLEAQQINESELELAATKAAMSPTEIDKVIRTTRELREAQLAEDSEENRASLPRLDLSDIDRVVHEIPSSHVDLSTHGFENTRMFTHDLETNGILYVDLAFDYSQILLEDVPLLPLFARMLMESGTLQLDETALSRQIGTHTGGISVGFHNDLRTASGTVSNPDEVLLYLMLRGKAVTNKIPILFHLFTDILLNARLNNQKRAVEMLKESKSRKEASLLSSGHSYGATRIAGRHSFLGHLAEVTGGLSAVREAQSLVESAENDWPALQGRLERMRHAIIRSNDIVVNLTGDKVLLSAADESVDKFLDSIPRDAFSAVNAPSLIEQWKASPRLLTLQDEAFVIPSQVNYVCLGGPLVPPGEAVKGSDSVVTRFLGNGFLWDQIRVVGGAYGAFASFSEASGRFAYLSYRDPSVLNTIDVFDKAPSALERPVSGEDLLQAVIGAVGDLDAPLSPDQKGFAAMVQLLSGETASDRQQWREEVLSTTPTDFHTFGSKLKRLIGLPGTLAVFGNQKDLALANEGLPRDRQMVINPAVLQKA